MIAITHFVIGMALGLVFFTGLTNRVDNSTIAVLSGFWALGPDIHKFIPYFDGLHNSLWSNVFWLHGVFDAVETVYPQAEAFAACAFLLFTVALFEYKDYY